MVFHSKIHRWQEITTDNTVLNWIKHGVHVPFLTEPNSFELQNHSLNNKETEFVDNEISDLLLLGAIEKLDYKPQCVSPLKSVHILTDNFSAMTCMNHGGGPSAQLTTLAKAIWIKTH